MRRCFATEVCSRNATNRRNTGLGVGEATTGAVECAAMHTWQEADSPASVWWCMANAIADHNVSNRESHAMRFEIDRMPISPRCVYRIYTETRTECNEKWVTTSETMRWSAKNSQSLIDTMSISRVASSNCAYSAHAQRSLNNRHLAFIDRSINN